MPYIFQKIMEEIKLILNDIMVFWYNKLLFIKGYIMSRLIQVLLYLFIFSTQSFSAQDKASSKLTLGFMPYLSSDILLNKYTPLATYLSQELNIKVEIIIAKDYATHIEYTGNNKLDISFLGGSPYVVIDEKYGQKPLLARYEFSNKPTFHSVIFVNKNSKLKTLSELKGKKVAFGNKNSTLSTQVPLYMLMNDDVYLKDLATHKHLRNHENVIYGVIYGEFDAGAVAQEVFREKESEGIKILKVSPEVSTHVFVTRSNMDKELQIKIKKALLKLKTMPNGNKVLKSISKNLTGFVDAIDEDYDYHRDMLKSVLQQLK